MAQIKRENLEREAEIVRFDGELQLKKIENKNLEQRLYKTKVLTLFLVICTVIHLCQQQARMPLSIINLSEFDDFEYYEPPKVDPTAEALIDNPTFNELYDLLIHKKEANHTERVVVKPIDTDRSFEREIKRHHSED